jgi:hypothetical protein
MRKAIILKRYYICESDILRCLPENSMGFSGASDAGAYATYAA